MQEFDPESPPKPSQDVRVYWNAAQCSQLLKKAVNSKTLANLKRSSTTAGLASPTRSHSPALADVSADGSFSSEASHSSLSISSSRISKRRRSAMRESIANQQHESDLALQRISELASLLNPVDRLQDKTNLIRTGSPVKPTKTFARTRSEPTAVLNPSRLVTKQKSTDFVHLIPPTVLEQSPAQLPKPPPTAAPQTSRSDEEELRHRTQGMSIEDVKAKEETDDLLAETSFDAAISTLDDNALEDFILQASQTATQRQALSKSKPKASSSQLLPLAPAKKQGLAAPNPPFKSQGKSAAPNYRPVTRPAMAPVSQEKLKQPFKAPTRVDTAKPTPPPVRQPVAAATSQRAAVKKTAPQRAQAEVHPELQAALEDGLGDFFTADVGDVSF